jgi:hypothetical protein
MALFGRGAHMAMLMRRSTPLF